MYLLLLFNLIQNISTVAYGSPNSSWNNPIRNKILPLKEIAFKRWLA